MAIALLAKLKQRFVKELPLWRLRPWQFALLVFLAAWPWLVLMAVPGSSVLAFGPVVLFLPFAYLGGSALASLLPGVAYAYAFGASTTIFSLAYLALVSWRLRRGAHKRS